MFHSPPPPQQPACAHRFRSKMEAAGFTISGANHPICPVMLGDARLASCMADDMLKRGKGTRTRGTRCREEGGTPRLNTLPFHHPATPVRPCVCPSLKTPGHEAGPSETRC